MRRGDHTFAISVAASLVLHAAILMVMLHQQGPVPASARSAPPPAHRPASIFIDDRPDASEGFGAADGSGNAANAAPGDELMLGRDAEQMQAFLSRDPVGPGSVGDDPSMSVLPKNPAAMQDAGAVVAMIGAAPSHAGDFVTPTLPRHGNDDTSLVRTKDSPVAMSHSLSQGATAGSSISPADPATMSESESDAFATGMAVEFRDGRVDARLGRKVKTVRPKLNLAAKIDLMSMNSPRMIVRVNVDTEGAVRLVDIIRSSGSEGADQAVKVSLYQWWFDPKKDDAGRAVASVLTFPIVWR